MALSQAERSRRWRKRHPTHARAVARETQRKLRAEAREASHVDITYPPIPANPAKAVSKWAAAKLVVPPGHPKAGQPMELPSYLVEFFADALKPDCMESLNCLARKNSKSGAVAVLLLAHLVGPLMRPGWRAGVASLSRQKAGELRLQVESIADASGLKDIRFWHRSAPSITAPGGSVDILAADANSGAASGFDLAIVDEIGLLKEKHRALVNSLRSSVSAKGGRFMALSVFGDGPFVPEILARRNDPSVCVHLHQAAEGGALDSEEAWHAANPGLKIGIKSMNYMRAESRRVLATPADQASFRALDLNQPATPSSELLATVNDWRRCVVSPGALPARDGECVVGFDLGGSASMTALAAVWPETGRLECFGAFPGTPSLAERGVADGVGDTYVQMEARGELKVYAGRITPVGEFLTDCANRLAGQRILAAAADRYRKEEGIQALEAAELRWPMHWRGQGAKSTADGSADVRAFQKWTLQALFSAVDSLLLEHGLKNAVIRRDGGGNPALEKAKMRGRIDICSAAVMAAGLAERLRGLRREPVRLHRVA